MSSVLPLSQEWHWVSILCKICLLGELFFTFQVYIYLSIYLYLSLSLYIYIYIYICMHIYIYIYIHVCVYIYIYIFTGRALLHVPGHTYCTII